MWTWTHTGTDYPYMHTCIHAYIHRTRADSFQDVQTHTGAYYPYMHTCIHTCIRPPYTCWILSRCPDTYRCILSVHAYMHIYMHKTTVHVLHSFKMSRAHTHTHLCANVLYANDGEENYVSHTTHTYMYTHARTHTRRILVPHVIVSTWTHTNTHYTYIHAYLYIYI
jgi:hypothetical protein